MRIGLVGDYQEAVTAHRAIPKALELAAAAISASVEFKWLHSTILPELDFEEYSGVWCVPASPYENDESVLLTIKHVRENDVPFLGTCGGYQYAALEFAQNQLGFTEADNAEVNPATNMPLISNLSCKLYDKSTTIRLDSSSIISKAYAETTINEEYYCGYGVNRKYLHIYQDSDMYFSGFDEDGDPRSLEIPKNKFFIGTAYQPERSALKGAAHPLICAYLQAIINDQ